jgi:hypothetical protein
MDSDDEEDDEACIESRKTDDEEDDEACTELTKTDVTDLLDCFHVEGDSEDDDEYD